MVKKPEVGGYYLYEIVGNIYECVVTEMWEPQPGYFKFQGPTIGMLMFKDRSVCELTESDLQWMTPLEIWE